MIREWFVKGGLVMYPLLLCSITAMAVSIERVLFFIRLRRSESAAARHLEMAQRLLAAGAREDALRVLTQADSPGSHVLTAGLAAKDNGRLEMESVSDKERRKFFSGLAVLDTIVTAAPLLGLLGTVTGIINTFRLIGDPSRLRMQAVGLGMAEALITTATGLIIAIPALVVMNYFAHRATRTAEELDRLVKEFAIASEREV